MADGSTYNFVTTPIGIQDIARLAAELLEQRGWCQCMLENRTGAMCMLGALETAARLLKAWPLHVEAADAVRMELGENSIPFWNDKVERTQKDVVAVLRKVADG